MYKLVIVDDEALVREAIREQMDWASLGFDCVGDYEDGEEALEHIADNAPDVVLTDICMPFMDGLALTRELASRHPETKVLILTGFDEFDYARQAVELQAFDFILKPVTCAELARALLRLKDELDKDRARKDEYERLRKEMNESLPVLRERFLERLLTSRLPEREVAERCAYFDLSWNGEWLAAAMFDLEPPGEEECFSVLDEELLRFALFNIAQELFALRRGTAVFRDRNNQVLVLLSGAEPDALQEEAAAAAEELRIAADRYLPARISAGVGRSIQGLASAHLVYDSALSALDYRFVLGRGTIIRLMDMEQRSRPALASALAWEKELISKMKTATAEETDDVVTRLFAAFRAQAFTAEACRIYAQRIALAMAQTVYEMDGATDDSLGDADTPLFAPSKFGTLVEMEQWMKRLCRQAARLIRGARENFGAGQVAKAKAFVDARYADPELSLGTVCQHVAMSTSYFSTLFKSHAGHTFVEYLTRVRMEQAKALLKLTGKKSSEIAYEVGYADPHYFSGAFKKHTGMTPTEYRQKIAEEIGS
ncbi:response regulator [Paenibacillus methanolicus]|uniref:Two-component system response regulator YesN n=1 Tax=Paenibacillus methanolicus TaxID=582686 RepID=A0A5S5CHI8_9BACL|nr:response regulator [Paenibacillus methanolicus]TYP79259.1 two-component system response regulator YesN [Paenibacillus methanolicus]